MEKIESLQKNAKQMLRHTKTKCMPPLTIDVLQSKSAEEQTSRKLSFFYLNGLHEDKETE